MQLKVEVCAIHQHPLFHFGNDWAWHLVSRKLVAVHLVKPAGHCLLLYVQSCGCSVVLLIP